MKKIIAMSIVFMLVLASFGGCQPKQNTSSSNGSTSSSKSSGDTSKTSLNTSKKIELQVMLTPQWKGVFDQTVAGADYGDYFKYAGQKFSEKYPNVSFNVNVVAASERTAVLNSNLQAGTPPDILFDTVMVLTDFAHMGAMVPIDDIIDDSSKKDIPENILDAGKVAGKQFFYPFSQSLGLLAVNNNYMKQAGLESMLPKQSELGKWTPEEFKSALTAMKQKVKVEGFYPFGLYAGNDQSDQYNNSYLKMFGAQMFNADSSACTINSAEGVKAMEFIKSLSDEKLTQPSPESTVASATRDMFRNQKLAVCYNLTSHYTELVADMKSGKLAPFDFSLFLLPGEKQPISFSMLYGGCCFDTSDSDKIAFSKEFVKFFSSEPELAKASATHCIPVRTSVVQAVKAEKPYIELINKATPFTLDYTGGIPNFIGFRALLFPTYQAVLTGGKAPETAMDDLAKNATALITEGRADSTLY